MHWNYYHSKSALNCNVELIAMYVGSSKVKCEAPDCQLITTLSVYGQNLIDCFIIQLLKPIVFVVLFHLLLNRVCDSTFLKVSCDEVRRQLSGLERDAPESHLAVWSFYRRPISV